MVSFALCVLNDIKLLSRVHDRVGFLRHFAGMFSFSAQSLRACSGESLSSTVQLTATSIVEFIQQAMVESHRCREGQSVYTLQPKPPGLHPIPVRLLYPVSRPQEQLTVPAMNGSGLDTTVDRQSPQLHSRPSHTTVSVKVDVH